MTKQEWLEDGKILFMGGGDSTKMGCGALHDLLDDLLSHLGGEQQCGIGPDQSSEDATQARNFIRRDLKVLCSKFGEKIEFVDDCHEVSSKE